MSLRPVPFYDAGRRGVKQNRSYALANRAPSDEIYSRTRHSLGGRSHESHVRKRTGWTGDVGSDATDPTREADAGRSTALVAADSRAGSRCSCRRAEAQEGQQAEEEGGEEGSQESSQEAQEEWQE